MAAARPDRFAALAQDDFVEDDIAVLNNALTLENLEYSVYRDGIGQFDFGTDPFGNSINDYMTTIRDREGAHVAILTQVISDLGGEPVEEAEYEFPYADLASFLAFAQAVEDLGVGAYNGAARYIENSDLLTAALTIHANEARHAAYLALLNGASPFPAAFDQALPPADVLEVAGPLIVS